MSSVARLEEQRTATYCAVITESGELSLGLGDMDIHEQITEQYVSSVTDQSIIFSQACQGSMFGKFSVSQVFSPPLYLIPLDVFPTGVPV